MIAGAVPVLGAVFALCLVGVTRGGEFETAVIDKMNLCRGRVSPAAKDMNKLVYDTRLAGIASSWASKCTFGHNPGRSRNYPGYVGENMYATTETKSSKALVMAAIESWNSERSNYNYNTDTCKPGKVCGHYTQLVWATTKKVGCAVKKCRRASRLPRSFSPVSIVVCNFSPGGNYRGVKPYSKGTSCSGCSTSCEENLCAPQASAMLASVENLNVHHSSVLGGMSVVVFLIAGVVVAGWWGRKAWDRDNVYSIEEDNDGDY